MMFVVREAQIEAMLEPMRRRFVEGTRSWLRGKYPYKLEAMNDDALRAFVRKGMERAMKYGIDTEASMAQFIEVTVVAGEEFDQKPENGWLKGFLENTRVPAADKAAYVHKQLVPPQE